MFILKVEVETTLSVLSNRNQKMGNMPRTQNQSQQWVPSAQWMRLQMLEGRKNFAESLGGQRPADWDCEDAFAFIEQLFFFFSSIFKMPSK